MEHRVAPVLAEVRHIRHLVVHPGRQDQGTGPDLAAPVPEHHEEAVAFGAAVDRLGVPNDDRVVAGELLAGASVELARRRALLAEQAPTCAAGRLLCPLRSSTGVRRRARPRTSAALRPATPPPMTTHSQSLFMPTDENDSHLAFASRAPTCGP
jgi:hypothetical protein